MPNYATIDSDDRIPFWRELGERSTQHDCKFILQLSHGGRQRDIRDREQYPQGQSSTNKHDPLHGFECERDDARQTSRKTVSASPRAPAARARPGSTASSCTAPTAI